MNVIRYLAISVIASLSYSASAELPFSYNLGAHASYTKVKTAGNTFNPNMLQINANVSANRGILAGIGLEALYATAINDDTQASTTLEISQQTGLYISLSDPDHDPEDLKFSLLLGYASTSIATNTPNLNGLYNDSFSDFSYGIRLEDQIISGKPFFWSFTCTHFYSDENLRVDGCGLGASYGF
jgi:hypothetical protein